MTIEDLMLRLDDVYANIDSANDNGHYKLADSMQKHANVINLEIQCFIEQSEIF